MNEYYIAKPGTSEPIGPMTTEQIRMGVQQGSITMDYYYCTPQSSEWKPLAELLNSNTVYGAPRMNMAPAAAGMKPSNHMGMAIFCTLCCCLPLGIVAIIKASSVDTLWAQGRYNEARSAADSASQFCTWGIILGIIVNILSFVIQFSLLKSSSPSPYYY